MALTSIQPALTRAARLLRRTSAASTLVPEERLPPLARYLFQSTSGRCRAQLGAAPSKLTRPIYSVSESFSSRRALANTTAGTFAPSSFASDARATSAKLQPDGSCSDQLSILDGSDHLPSLPVPDLRQTLERLKETIWPITMNSAEFAGALELIEAFSGSAGQKLDLLLRAKANQTKNWLTEDWWTEEAYLKSRAPLVINSNPAMIYPDLPYEVNNQRKLISTMAQLVSGVIDFKLALLQGYNPEAQRGQDEFRLNANLCYNQYRHIFGSTRMPGEGMDTVQLRPLNDDLPADAGKTGTLSNKFQLVLSVRGQFYEIQLNSIDHEQDRIETLQSIFSKIVDHASAASPSAAFVGDVGVLTADTRDNWSKSIRLLDAESVRAIREAHLVVCLDTIPSEPEDKFLQALLQTGAQQPDELRAEALSRQVLHSDRANVGNRWFDKSLQLVLATDENMQRFLGAGINYEHSIAEAMVVTKLIEYSYDKTVQQKNLADQQMASGKQQHADGSGASARYRRLEMVDEANSAEVERLVQRAKRDFGSQLDQFDLAYFNYKQYGSNSIKSWRFSPDSWFQVGLQLAHYRVHRRLNPCYESASTRQFAYGRTETIRSLTKDVGEFCREPSFNTLRAAIAQHKAYANAANEAAAIDRVLLGYRLIFNELKANKWAWGLPTFDECQGLSMNESGSLSGESKHARRLRFDSLDMADSKQQVDLNDLFTEEELSVLGAFFNNELIARSKKFALSTSQVSSVHPNICMSYGPFLADGYGCCYNISGQKIVAAITANSSNKSFSCAVDKLSESLGDSLDLMRNIVEGQQQRSKNV